MNDTSQQLLQLIKEQVPDAYRQYVLFQISNQWEWAIVNLFEFIFFIFFLVALIILLKHPWKSSYDDSFVKIIHIIVCVIVGLVGIFAFLVPALDHFYTIFQIYLAPKGFIIYNYLGR